MYIDDLKKEHEGKIQTTSTGLEYVVTEAGQGSDKPKKGDVIKAHYTGKLIDGSEFDSSVSRGPFEFQVGLGQVIAGWDEAFLEMTKGEKRVLILPPELAYGKEGVGPIPPDAVLVFEVELLEF